MRYIDTLSLTHDAARKAATAWFAEACREPWATFHLWHRRAAAGEIIAQPVIAKASPGPEWTRDIEIPSNLTVEHVACRLRDRLGSLPILNGLAIAAANTCTRHR